MTDPTIEYIAEQAATRAVRSTLLQLGIDVENPIEAQRDFFMLREFTKLVSDPEFKKDLAHIRTWRVRTEGVTIKGILTSVTLLMGGLLTTLWVGVQHLVGK